MDERSSEPKEWYREPTEPVDDNLVPAILAGLGAAAVGGVVWALIVNLTGYEVGFVAWALGGFVGFAMARSTPIRSKPLAISGATLALVGLLVGRVLIAMFSTVGPAIDEIVDDPELLAQAVMIEAQLEGELSEVLPSTIMEEWEATEASGDTISDALYERALAAAGTHAQTLSEEEREDAARTFAELIFGATDLQSMVMAQFSGFDILWLFFAMSTAWSMLNVPKEDGGGDEDTVGNGPTPQEAGTI